jgi:UDP-N-acetylmuramoyl-tripeptide--D-alanyl-D-alanine ligase
VFRLSEAASALGAEQIGPDALITGVSTDTRTVRSGDAFVALKGARFDGHRFVPDAIAAGAAGALVSDRTSVPSGAAGLVVSDTRLALGRLASWWRDRFPLDVIAVTGSNGKTTVKEMLAAALRAHAGESAVLATQGNLNNDIGVPLTLFRLRREHRYAVIEMGMNHPGEIGYLSRLTRPTAALINNAGTAHIGEVGSVEGIARAKGEIFEGLNPKGIAVINGDDAFADYWRGLVRGRRVIDFGLDKRVKVRARYELSEGGSLVTISTPDREFIVRLAVPGVHNVKNALAAASASWALDVPIESIAAGLSAYTGTRGRLQQRRLAGGALLIDDTYNANPESMKAALSVLSGFAGRRIFVMGDMGELGDAASAMHAEIGVFARRAGIDAFYALGEASAAAARAFGEGARHFESVDALVAALQPCVDAHTVVLVKGSRFMRMERVADALAGEASSVGGEH